MNLKKLHTKSGVHSHDLKLDKGAIIRRYKGAILVSPGLQAPLGHNLRRCWGRGKVRRRGVAKKKRSVLETCKSLLHSRLTEFKVSIFLSLLFFSHSMYQIT